MPALPFSSQWRCFPQSFLFCVFKEEFVTHNKLTFGLECCDLLSAINTSRHDGWSPFAEEEFVSDYCTQSGYFYHRYLEVQLIHLNLYFPAFVASRLQCRRQEKTEQLFDRRSVSRFDASEHRCCDNNHPSISILVCIPIIGNITMFDNSSQEKEAHHQFMALGPDQQKEVSNHELFGNAAAYHAASSFTDHCEKNGVPESTDEAQKLVLGYANDFVNTQIDSKGLKLDKGESLKFATHCLGKQMTSASPAAWMLSHPTPGKSFDSWTSTAKEFRMPTKSDGTPDYEMIRWANTHGVVF